MSKFCTRCTTTKPLLEFLKNKARKDGVSVYCKLCTKDYMAGKTYDKDRWTTHKEQESARSAAYRANNKERLAEYWRLKAEEKRRNNPCIIRRFNIARKHGEKLATPSWCDIEAVNSVYKEARRLESIDGIKRHVDHIIPLKHPLVCGLHVHNNLQVLTAEENMKKHNNFSIQ